MSRLFTILLLFVAAAPAGADQLAEGTFYAGVYPSILFEPYDVYENTVEVNVVPVTFAYRPFTNTSLEVRPQVFLRFLPDSSHVSRVGGTLAGHRYFARDALPDWVALQAGPFVTFTRSDRDRESVWIFGGEFGAAFFPNERFSVTVAAQPGMNYYTATVVPGRTWLPHFGVVAQFGWTFGLPGVD